MESIISLIWIIVLAASLIIAAIGVSLGGEDVFGFVARVGDRDRHGRDPQLIVALWIEHGYDRTAVRALLLGALYPPAYWILAASAALRSETVALVRGPREQRVVWDIPREPVDAGVAPREPS